jgi:hypothetical protein
MALVSRDKAGKTISVGTTGTIAFTIVALYDDFNERGERETYCDIKLTDGHLGVTNGFSPIVKRVPTRLGAT